MAINEIVKPPFDSTAQLIRAGNAFVNPYTSAITQLTTKTAQLVADMPTLISNPNIAPHADTILQSIGILDTTIAKFTGHTNRLSGLTMTGGVDAINFATISSVLATVQKYGNDGSACELIFGAFGAIVKAAQYITDIMGLIAKIENIDELASQLPDVIDNLVNALENQMTTDTAVFVSAQITALQYAAAAALTELSGNPCISEIISIIGSAELRKVAIPAVRNIL